MEIAFHRSEPAVSSQLFIEACSHTGQKGNRMNILLAQLEPFSQLVAQVRQNPPAGGADTGAGAGVAGVIFGICYALFIVLILAILIASHWKIFSKAGQPGWAAIIPIYNRMVLAEVCGKPAWWGILIYVPCVGIIFHILLMLELPKRFGKEIGYAIGLILLPIIFLPMLAFGSAQYIPPETSGSACDDDDRPRRRRREPDEEEDEDRPRRRRPRDEDDDR
jgi:hypothetical protein